MRAWLAILDQELSKQTTSLFISYHRLNCSIYTIQFYVKFTNKRSVIVPRFLIYVDAKDISVISEAFDQMDAGTVEEYFTLTEDGSPIVFDENMVSNPDFCNGLAIRCAGITEE
jgi:hypothetical protein